MDLGQAPARDQQGMAGWTGYVTPHDWRLFGAIVIGGVRRGGTPAVRTEAAGAGPVGHAPALGRGLGGSPRQRRRWAPCLAR
jgi:type IV secretory pathway VirB10-like protein